jgi:hypothetical protein
VHATRRGIWYRIGQRVCAWRTAHSLVCGRWNFQAQGWERVTNTVIAMADWRTKQTNPLLFTPRVQSRSVRQLLYTLYREKTNKYSKLTGLERSNVQPDTGFYNSGFTWFSSIHPSQYQGNAWNWTTTYRIFHVHPQPLLSNSPTIQHQAVYTRSAGFPVMSLTLTYLRVLVVPHVKGSRH